MMNKKSQKKPVIGVYSFSSCSGCQIEILNIEEHILDIMNNFNIKCFHLIQADNDEAFEVDIAFIEGTITTSKQLQRLKNIRDKAKVIVAIGSCACTGGIPSMRCNEDPNRLKKQAYHDEKSATHIKPIKARGIDRFIKVDYYVRGCPITKEEFIDVVLSLLSGNRPYQRPYPVCTECRLNEVDCLLDQGIVCLGPITYMGCGAICTKQGLQCVGCRGTFEDSRLQAYLELLKSKKISKKKIVETFDKYVEDVFDKKAIEKALR